MDTCLVQSAWKFVEESFYIRHVEKLYNCTYIQYFKIATLHKQLLDLHRSVQYLKFEIQQHAIVPNFEIFLKYCLYHKR